METDEDEILARLFFKKYGRALPEKEKEKEKENDVDNIKFVIDLTDEKDDEEMEVATPVVVVKKEPIEVVDVAIVSNINNVTNFTSVVGSRVSRRLELIELAKARKAITEFGKSLRKKELIPEKEVPDDTDMAEDEPVNTVETVEQTIAASEAAIAASEAAIEFTAEFGDTPIDEFDD